MTLEEMFEMEKKAGTRRKPTHEEDQLQMSCRHWFDYQYPGLSRLLHHSPNEGRLVGGASAGAKRKAMGVVAGFPDFILTIPSKHYPALAIELKSKTGRQSDTQKAWQKDFEEISGGLYVIVRTVEDFKAEINAYIYDCGPRVLSRTVRG